MKRAVSLILTYAGGVASEMIEMAIPEYLPSRKQINLAVDQVANILGVTIPEKKMSQILSALGFTHHCVGKEFIIEVPSHRFDVTSSLCR
jgi:phenylalanyl-tRNA synthetase beta chain